MRGGPAENLRLPSPNNIGQSELRPEGAHIIEWAWTSPQLLLQILDSKPSAGTHTYYIKIYINANGFCKGELHSPNRLTQLSEQIPSSYDSSLLPLNIARAAQAPALPIWHAFARLPESCS